ncbi:MAG TPA: transglycosylase domain-containing protein [Lentimicrobium sp.]|nr:transglycosylase domain-containing protein [Lentimicrobium sp.]
MDLRKGNRKRSVRIVIFSIAALALLFILLFFIFRNTILRRVIDGRLDSLYKSYSLKTSYEDARFSGISTIKIYKVSVTPEGRDTLAQIDSTSVSFKPLDLILNRLRFTNVELANISIRFVRKDTLSNYLFLLDRKKDSTIRDTIVKIPEKDYGSRVAVLMNAVFNHIPATTRIRNFSITANIDTNSFSFYMPGLVISDRNFNTSVEVSENNKVNHWLISGHLDPANKDLELSIKSGDEGKVRIPYIKKRWNTYIAFDSAQISLAWQRINDISKLSGDALLAGPVVNHKRISPDDVELKQSRISYALNVGRSYIEVDSSTYVSFNETGFHPYVMYIGQPAKLLTFSINEPSFDAQSFFNSLPAKLFNNLEGIKVRGDLSFHLDFRLAFSQPDSLYFDAALKGKNFAVERFGNTNFTYINEPFIYTAYENGRPVREIIVGEANPNFRRLDEIPEHLKNAIMTSEDGQFYYHNGFVPDAIRYSIVTNIKEKRFARGGSTISMQLVKNVFLNRNKNITRKIEEMLITWLIESRRMVSKDRMLEVYLNIIETGPMTYGVNEAAHFYFKKDVSKLTLAESIYIASIVPRPKLFKYSFDKEGNLRDYVTNYYTLVSGKMLNRGWITQEEYDNLKPEITIKGPAREYIVTDTIPSEDEIIMERKNFFDFLKLDIFKRKKRN